MSLQWYGPQQLHSLVEKFFRTIESHLDRKDETRVVVGPARFLDGQVDVDRAEMRRMNEALEFYHGIFVKARYGLPAPTQKEMKNGTKRIDLFKQRYSFAQNADGMYNPVIDTIVLSFAQLYERFVHELRSPSRFVKPAFDYAFAHECVHWDLGGTAPANALRAINTTPFSTAPLYGKKSEEFIGRIGEAKAELESTGCIVENADDIRFNAVLKRMRLSLRYQLEEGLCYAIEHALHGDDHDEAPFAQYSRNGDESIMRTAYAWAQTNIEKKGIKTTIQRVKSEINAAFEQDGSPVEFLSSR